MSLATVIGETHRRFVQKFARFPSGARRKAREREKRKKGSDPSLLFIQSRKNEPWEKEGWLVLEEGGQGMMSAVIETEKIGGERERERRGRKREKVGVEGGMAGGRRIGERLNRGRCQPLLSSTEIFVGLEFCFTPDHENGYNEWRLVSALSC